jgi:hypothetical protein
VSRSIAAITRPSLFPIVDVDKESQLACPKTGHHGSVINEENWSMRKGGQLRIGQRRKRAKIPSFDFLTKCFEIHKSSLFGIYTI